MALDGHPKDCLRITQVNLTEHPFGIGFIVEVAGHIKPVCAPVVHVVTSGFDTFELADTS